MKGAAVYDLFPSHNSLHRAHNLSVHIHTPSLSRDTHVNSGIGSMLLTPPRATARCRRCAAHARRRAYGTVCACATLRMLMAMCVRVCVCCAGNTLEAIAARASAEAVADATQRLQAVSSGGKCWSIDEERAKAVDAMAAK